MKFARYGNSYTQLAPEAARRGALPPPPMAAFLPRSHTVGQALFSARPHGSRSQVRLLLYARGTSCASQLYDHFKGCKMWSRLWSRAGLGLRVSGSFDYL